MLGLVGLLRDDSSALGAVGLGVNVDRSCPSTACNESAFIDHYKLRISEDSPANARGADAKPFSIGDFKRAFGETSRLCDQIFGV